MPERTQAAEFARREVEPGLVAHSSVSRTPLERALDREPDTSPSPWRACPSPAEKQCAVDRDRQEERRPRDELRAVEVAAPAARWRGRVDRPASGGGIPSTPRNGRSSTARPCWSRPMRASASSRQPEDVLVARVDAETLVQRRFPTARVREAVLADPHLLDPIDKRLARPRSAHLDRPDKRVSVVEVRFARLELRPLGRPLQIRSRLEPPAGIEGREADGVAARSSASAEVAREVAVKGAPLEGDLVNGHSRSAAPGHAQDGPSGRARSRPRSPGSQRAAEAPSEVLVHDHDQNDSGAGEHGQRDQRPRVAIRRQRSELEQPPHRVDDALDRRHVRVLDLPVRVRNVVARSRAAPARCRSRIAFSARIAASSAAKPHDARRLLHDHDAAGLRGRGEQRLLVERLQRADVEHLDRRLALERVGRRSRRPAPSTRRRRASGRCPRGRPAPCRAGRRARRPGTSPRIVR